MFGRIYVWSHLVLSFSFLGSFWLLIQSPYWLCICSNFLFIHDSVLVGFVVLGICPFCQVIQFVNVQLFIGSYNPFHSCKNGSNDPSLSCVIFVIWASLFFPYQSSYSLSFCVVFSQNLHLALLIFSIILNFIYLCSNIYYFLLLVLVWVFSSISISIRCKIRWLIKNLYSFFFNLFIYFWLCWVFVSVQGLSLVAASGGHASSWCAGLSLSRPLLLQSTGSRRAGSVVVAHGPSCSAASGILPDQGSNPCPLRWQEDSQLLHHQGSPYSFLMLSLHV